MVGTMLATVNQGNLLTSITMFLALVLAFILVTLAASHVVGPRRAGKIKSMPYESGMDPVGEARGRINSRFYLIALLFLLFDVELAFFYPWAKLLGSENLADPQRLILFAGMVGFAGLLILAYVYAWIKGVFCW